MKSISNTNDLNLNLKGTLFRKSKKCVVIWIIIIIFLLILACAIATAITLPLVLLNNKSTSPPSPLNQFSLVSFSKLIYLTKTNQQRALKQETEQFPNEEQYTNEVL